MLDVGFPHAFQTVSLHQLDDPAKARSHVGGERFDLLRDPIVKQLDDPFHSVGSLLQKCNDYNPPWLRMRAG
jgi:hypothetical protein